MDEFLTYFPEYTKIYNICKNKLTNCIKELEFIYNKIKDIKEQKAFALKATKHKCSSVLFKMRNKQIDNIKEGVLDIRSKALVELLQLKSEKII